MPAALPPPGLAANWKLSALVADADHCIGRLDGAGTWLSNPYLLIKPVQRREAILSSRIEGTITHAKQLALLRIDDDLVSAKPSEVEDAREVENYVTALTHGLGSPLPLCLRLLRECHERLMAGVRGEDKTPGEFRRIQNAIGSSDDSISSARYVPPPPERLPEALDHFEKFLNAKSPLPLLVRIALVHYQFEAIHPFIDGNGRLGRLLVPLMLQREHRLGQPLLYVSAYFEKHRRRYVDSLLRVSTQGAWTEWLEFFLTGVAEQAADTIDRIKRLQGLQSSWYALASDTTRSRHAHTLVDLLFTTPALRVRDVEAATGMSFPGALNLIEKLVHAKVLEEVTGNARNRVFVANGVLEITDE